MVACLEISLASWCLLDLPFSYFGFYRIYGKNGISLTTIANKWLPSDHSALYID